jgi:N-methylhydantoinase B
MVKALSEVFHDRICAAGKGIICNISFGGIDPRTNQVYAFIETVGGGYGARPIKDGMDAVQYHLTNTQNAPIEELEISYPVLIERYQLIPDSEGAGKYRGGLGIRRDYRFNDHSATFSVLSDRSKFSPWGLAGGLNASPSRYIVNPDSESPMILRSKQVIKLKPGDLVSVQTPGGGGYGKPSERDIEKVLLDVRNEKISLERARRVYGVDIDPLSYRVKSNLVTRVDS